MVRIAKPSGRRDLPTKDGWVETARPLPCHQHARTVPFLGLWAVTLTLAECPGSAWQRGREICALQNDCTSALGKMDILLICPRQCLYTEKAQHNMAE